MTIGKTIEFPPGQVHVFGVLKTLNVFDVHGVVYISSGDRSTYFGGNTLRCDATATFTQDLTVPKVKTSGVLLDVQGGSSGVTIRDDSELLMDINHAGVSTLKPLTALGSAKFRAQYTVSEDAWV